jgi:histidinol-phosphate aminotransferase
LASLRYPHIYPDPESRVLRRALAEYTGVPEENLVAGAGVDELIDLSMRLFVLQGDAIVTCPPTFGMYPFDAAISAARVVSVVRHLDFSLDLDAIDAAVKRYAPKLLFLACPNNPDGGWITQQDLERLLTLPVVVVLDEAYVEFAGPGCSRIRKVMERDNLIVLRTFSKLAGLAGLRIGYGAFPSAIMPHLWKIKQPYNVSVAASAAALAALDDRTWMEEKVALIVEERERLSRALAGFPFLEPYPSRANFVLCQVVGHGAQALKAGLEDHGILIRYFDQPGLRDHVRISVGRPKDTDRVLGALGQWVAAPSRT